MPGSKFGGPVEFFPVRGSATDILYEDATTGDYKG
jgi:hypothetical protein